MKKILIMIGLVISLCSSLPAQTITLRDTLFLSKATHMNDDLASWDSVFVKIMRGSVLVSRIKLTEGDSGEYAGVYKPTYSGDFVAQYYAVYAGEIIREEEYFSVLDTTAFMGSAAGLTAQEIVDSLVGRGWFPGTGAYACTVQVRDSSAEAGINAVHVIIRNNDQSATIRHGWTNADGKVWFALDSLGTGASYKPWLLQLGYNFVFPETMDVRGPDTWTFYGTAFDWGGPPPDSQTMVAGQIFDLTLDSLSGVKVSAKLYIPAGGILHYHEHPITPFEVVDTTGADGKFRLNLLSNDLLWPQPNHYIFNFIYPATKDGKFFIKADTVDVPYSATAVEYGTLKGW